MSGKMTRVAYEQMIRENLAWLEKQPRTLERDHIIDIVKASPDHEYDPERDRYEAALKELRAYPQTDAAKMILDAVLWPEGPRIREAAIMIDEVPWVGPSHDAIIKDIVKHGGKTPVTGEQGFVTDSGAWVTREEAAKIAFKAGQIPKEKPALFSEDLGDLVRKKA